MTEGVQEALDDALEAYRGIDQAREDHRLKVTVFIHAAREANWTWQEIGRALHVTDTGARRFYFRNRGRLVQT